MRDIMRRFHNDQEIAHELGSDMLDLLRWVLLSNRSHLISIPKELTLREFSSSTQFMTLLSSPEAETQFEQLKAKYGSMFLWHGSHGQRWHSILRNGLKNATGTTLEQNGHAHGEGIYMARNSSTSWGYSRSSKNLYPRSALGKTLHLIALCEVAKVREGSYLKDHGWAHTLTMEEACIVRFLMVGGEYTVDVITTPPSYVPTLRDVLEFHADRSAVTLIN
jgi:poly [ADP-ribose] polymerase 6/8